MDINKSERNKTDQDIEMGVFQEHIKRIKAI